MENLTYVTGNIGKYISVKNHFEKHNIDINYEIYDLDEPDVNDISLISKFKAIDAYDKVKSPVIVADSGFYIEHFPNFPLFPGAFVKRSGVSSNIDKLLDTMKDVKDRSCFFLDCLTFYDGNIFEQFYAYSYGTLAYEKRGEITESSKSNLWCIFIPVECTKTLTEMTLEERNNRPNKESSTEKFIEWYKEVYLKNNVKLTK